MDVFIGHETVDRELALSVSRELQACGVSVFMAPWSIGPGVNWSEAILHALRESRRVVVLASRAACASGFVNQEVGGALLADKVVIPVVWDVAPEQLPGWLSQRQAVDLRNARQSTWSDMWRSFAEEVQREKLATLVAFGVVFAFLCATRTRKGAGRRSP